MSELQYRKMKREPATNTRTTVIQRFSPADLRMMKGAPGGGRMSMSGRMSMGGPVFATGALNTAAQQDVSKVIQNSEGEKTEIQDLNKRFSSYIENSRYLEARLATTLAELENEKKKKRFDPAEIKILFEDEMDQMRKVIAQLEEDKAKLDTSIADLSDRLEDERRANKKLQAEYDELRKKLNKLNQTLGDLTGENVQLRANLEAKEKDLQIAMDLIQEKEDEIEAQRKNANHELQERLRIECEMNAQLSELQFLKNVDEETIEELRRILDSDTGSIDVKNVWDKQISEVVKQMQQDQQDAIARIKADYNARYDAQMAQLQGNQGIEQATIAKLQSEINRLKNQKSDGPKLAELESKLRILQDELIRLKRELEREENDHERDNDEKDNIIASLRAELAQINETLSGLNETNISLRTEINTYRKLLENEEKTFGKAIHEIGGGRTSGADVLADMIGGGGGGSGYSYSQSSSGGGRGGYGGGASTTYSYSQSSGSGGGLAGGVRGSSGGSSEFLQRAGGMSGSSEFLQQSGGGGYSGRAEPEATEEVSSMQQKISTSRTSKGNFSFGKVDTINGNFIEITSKQETNLIGWSIVKKTSKDSTRGGSEFVFTEDVWISANTPKKILKKGSRGEKGDYVGPWNDDFKTRFGFVLFDADKKEKASVTQTITMM